MFLVNLIMQNREALKKLIFNKYSLKSLIHSSGFGSVYEGINVKEKIPVAIKMEKRKSNFNTLESETYLLMNLKGHGIPNVITYGYHGIYNVLIEELLGLSIGDIFDSKKKTYNLKDICMIALQCIDRLEFIHSKYVIHRDIKPHNFVIGRNDPEVIYLIDFGLSRKYKSSRTGKHIQYKNIKLCYGSLRFLSINGNKGYEQSRRDDLESLGYMLIFLSTGNIPWNKIEKLNLKEAKKYILTYKLKLNTTPEELCKGLPEEMIKYINYCKGLYFEQEPDYNYLRSLFKLILTKINQENDLNFCWISNKILKGHKKKNKSQNKMLKRSVSPHIRLLNKIKTTLENNNKSSLLNIDNKKNKESFTKDELPLNIVYNINQDNDKDNLVDEFEMKSIKKYKKNLESESTKEKELKKINTEKSISTSFDKNEEIIIRNNNNKPFNNYRLIKVSNKQKTKNISKSLLNQRNKQIFYNKENKILKLNYQKTKYDDANIINLDNDNDIDNLQTKNLKKNKINEVDINKEIEKYIKNIDISEKSHSNNCNKNKFISINNFWDNDTGDFLEDNSYNTCYNVNLNSYNKDLFKNEENKKKDKKIYFSPNKNNDNINLNKDIIEKSKTFYANKIPNYKNDEILNSNDFVYNPKFMLRNNNLDLVNIKKFDSKYNDKTYNKYKTSNVNKNNNTSNIQFNNNNYQNYQNINKNEINITQKNFINRNYSPIKINLFNNSVTPINNKKILNYSKSNREISKKLKLNKKLIRLNINSINNETNNTFRNINLTQKNQFLFGQTNDFDEDINFVNSNKFESYDDSM